MAITYTPTTNFGAKDSLPTNDPDKVIKGSEFTTEFTAIQTAFGLAAPNASPTFTGTVTIGSVDINGGAIDGTTIGGATPAAGSFTTVSATGNITVGGTVDGRDVAADGTKLDGVEAGADVTDTANVTAAGALMDSELTDIAAVKALDQGVATTDSPSFAGLTATGSVSLAGASTSATINFPDGVGAYFGTGNDLQIYHSGTESIIADAGTGNLNLRGQNQIVLATASGSETYAAFNVNGASQLYYDNSAKLATTATGIDVTGTVTADGLTVNTISVAVSQEGSVLLGANAQYGMQLKQYTTDGGTPHASVVAPDDTNGWLSIEVGGDQNEAARFAANGDISFYEDTGTTAKFFWDASAEALGLGTTSPSALADIYDSASSSSNDLFHVRDYLGGGSDKTRLIVKNGGNVGIGTSSPASILDVTGASANVAKFKRSTVGTAEVLIDTVGSGDAQLVFADNGTDSYAIGRDNSNGDFVIAASGALGTNNLINIESGGNVGIGTSSPSSKLHVQGTSYFFDQSIFGDKIGIGTSSPATALDVAGTVTADGLTVNDTTGTVATFTSSGVTTALNMDNTHANGWGSNIAFKTGGTAAGYFGSIGSLLGNTDQDLSVYATAGNGFRVYTNGNNERLRVTSAGNVGIGTSSPGQALSVESSSVGVTRVSITNTGNAAAGAGVQLVTKNGATQVSNATLRTDNAGNFSIFSGTTGETERMRIDSSGNVGIGTTTAPGSNGKGIAIYQSDYPRLTFRNSTTGDGATDGTQFAGVGADFEIYNKENGFIAFGTNNTERMRIGSDGNVSIGTTSTGGNAAIVLSTSSFTIGIKHFASDGQTSNSFEVGGSLVGSITHTTTTTAYNTSSDARLKENIADAEDAGAKVDAIQVRQFDWKADGAHQDYGMIAQELLEVAPEAVSGDPESDDMMGVDYSKLVPMMLKEIQSLRARVAQLEGA